MDGGFLPQADRSDTKGARQKGEDHRKIRQGRGRCEVIGTRIAVDPQIGKRLQQRGRDRGDERTKQMKASILNELFHEKSFLLLYM